MKDWRAVCIDGWSKDFKAKNWEHGASILARASDMQKHIKEKHPEWKVKNKKQKHDWLLALVQLVVGTDPY